MPMTEWANSGASPSCRIIGVLDDGPAGLGPAALEALRRADLVIGGRRLLGLCAAELAPGAETRDLTGCLAQVPGWIRAAWAAGRRIAILATGDPLFHGIAGYLRSRLPDLPCQILPNLSTVQLACARLGLAWQDLRLISVHAQDGGDWHPDAGPEHPLYPLLQALQPGVRVEDTHNAPHHQGYAKPLAKVGVKHSSGALDPLGCGWPHMKVSVEDTRGVRHAQGGGGPPLTDTGTSTGGVAADEPFRPRLVILTSPANSPDRIARLLIQAGLADETRLSVAARLHRPDEVIFAHLAPAEAAAMTFPDPNLMVLSQRPPSHPAVLFGLADESFRQRRPERGLITKREVRAIALARLQLRSDTILWDLGAGSGAVGLEAARLCPQGFVYAIEKNAEDAAIARENARRLGLFNYRLTHARAPAGLADWPDPDSVFIGGSGGELADLIRLALRRLRDPGWLVMNFVTFENLHLALALLKDLGARWDLTQIQAARVQPILNMHRLAAENPVWVLAAQRGDAQI